MAENDSKQKNTNNPAVESIRESVKKLDVGVSINSRTIDGFTAEVNTVRNSMPAPTRPGSGGNDNKDQ